MKIEEYIDKFGQAAVDTSYKTGIFPSVKMGMALHESNAGNSELAAYHNNHFGIKAAGGWKGPVVNMKTKEVLNGAEQTVTDGFRVYGNPKDSFVDHTRFLKENKRYAKVFDATTPEAQVQAIKDAGYATDPKYVSKVVTYIEKWNLKDLDKKLSTMSKIYLYIGIALVLVGLYLLFQALSPKK